MPIFNPDVETRERKELLEFQNERLQIVVNQTYSRVDFYRKKFDEARVNPDDIKNLEDLKRIPFTTRKDLMDNYPYGMFAVPLRDVVRLQFPMGLYGNPIVIGYTRQDLKIWRELVARIMVGIGITEHDIIQVAFNYGLFFGAIRFNQSAELIGAAVVPTSIASAEVQLRIMQDFRSTVLASTPSFALHIIETMKRKRIDPQTLSLKIGLLGAEPWSESVRQVIEENLNIKAYDIYGVMELVEPGVAGECSARAGLHIFEDHFFAEVIDPRTGQALSAGREGELVLTTLTTNAYPLLRYRTSDVTALHYDRCSCGRTMVRMDRVIKRTDQMVSVRGINVFPEKIEEVLAGIDGVGPGYSMEVAEKKGMNDRLKVLVEASPEILVSKEERKTALQEAVQLALRRAIGLRVEVEIVAKDRVLGVGWRG
ncbi:MAG: phenylacetate--CoA ligase [Deltaproteobacteria bacterium]|nr:phenylacetate--CoA ligase [Deltaproteobacteria bacterium]